MSIPQSNETAFGYYQLGKYLQDRNQLEAATTAYEKALSIEPDHLEARNALGVATSLQGKLDIAIEHFRSALYQSPRSAHLHNNLGHAYYLQGKFAEAIESLESAARLDSRSHVTFHNLGLAYQAAGRTAQAEHAFRNSTAIRALHAAPAAAILVAEHIGKGGSSNRMADLVNTTELERSSKASSRTAHHNHSITNQVYTAGANGDLVLRNTDQDTTLILVESNVYELRAARFSPTPRALPAAAMNHAAGAAGTKLVRLEITNGNAVPGLAKAVADQLRRSGFNVMRLTNERPYTRASSELQYRDGHAEEATQLASVLRRGIIVARAQSLRSDVQLRLVLGQDVTTAATLLAPTPDQEGNHTTLVAQR